MLSLVRSPVDAEALDAMSEHARDATNFLKTLAHESRLMILCHLVTGEKTVTDLETLLSQRQPAVSQQLMRLRSEGLVTTRREGKAIYYGIADARVSIMIGALHDMFCGADSECQTVSTAEKPA